MTDMKTSNEKTKLSTIISEVEVILKDELKIDEAKIKKLIDIFFANGFLPSWYFTSNKPEKIANNIYTLANFINANTDSVRLLSKDAGEITYFLNVGRDYPGRLLSVLKENKVFELTGIDAESSPSGLILVNLLKDNTVNKDRFKVHSQKLNYIAKDENVVVKTLEEECLVLVRTQTPNNDFVTGVLEIANSQMLNMKKFNFDVFEEDGRDFGLLVLVFDNANNLDSFVKETEDFVKSHNQEEYSRQQEAKLEKIIHGLSTSDQEEFKQSYKALVELCEKNMKEESFNFYINAVTDLLKAHNEIFKNENLEILKVILGFESFNELHVRAQNNGEYENRPGYRTVHSSLRGPAKGGLRFDNIVNFIEVAALAFMMTWKCSRSGILFGGGKGGLMINPRTYDVKSLDYFDTVNCFGRSLFLVTGPTKDVPAGDVGCGPREIGFMFEGFKAGLRDLALLVYGVKDNITMVGDRHVSLDQAKQILAEDFDIDCAETPIIKHLCENEEYLELVVAPQITGKPKMGVQARTGATGRGLFYALIGTIANLYLADKWKIEEKLNVDEIEFLKEFSRYSEKVAMEKKGYPIAEEEIEQYFDEVCEKLLKGKRVIVQGSGKVGASIIEALEDYGVKFTAIADVGGAIIGEDLDSKAFLQAVEDSAHSKDLSRRASVINLDEGVDKKIYGAREGGAILEMECDILIPAALENAISARNVDKINAKIVLCGGNGVNTSIAEQALLDKGIVVVYDFLANGAGVTASYFEWLTNLNARFKYEAENIYNTVYDDAKMDPYLMPVYRDRIKEILKIKDAKASTIMWNKLLRDIMVSSVNEDFALAAENNISLIDSGYIRSQLRVLAKACSVGVLNTEDVKKALDSKYDRLLDFYMEHPEVKM